MTTPPTKRRVALPAALILAIALMPMTMAMAQTDEGADPEAWDNFAQEVLNEDVQEAMALAVLPDGRVLHNARSGDPDAEDEPAPFRLYDPETGESPIIAELDVYSFSEYGAQGMVLDPDFEDNGWIYIYYTPPHPDVPEGEAPYDSDDPSTWEDYEGANHLSRFDFVDGDEPTIDLDSEQVLLEVPQNLGMCCHLGGDLDFDSEGNLYLSTGDDSDPFESDEFTPIDEREERNPGFDAQRTASNTASLSGKLLRITPTDDGSYTVPEDNMFNSGAYDDLFPDGTYDEELALPEIYAMGLRNPFRFSVDQQTDTIYLGDYGPDAPDEDPERGPEATVSWHIIDEPANFGWPYCIGNNFSFVDYDFETEESGEPFDCDAPVNESPNNTGLTELPPTTPATVWDFNNSTSDEFPELGDGGGAPMGGPVYRYDEASDSDVAFPEFYDGTAFFYEWNQDYIKQFVLSEDGLELDEIRDFLPDWEFSAPMDMEFGPDGAMYLLEYGSGFFVESEEARLTRISFDPDADEPGQPTPPQPVTAFLDPEDPDGDNGWYVSPVTLTLESDDDEAELQWRLAGDDAWETWTEPVTIDTDGEHTVEYRAVWPSDDADEGNGDDANGNGDEGDGDADEGNGDEGNGDEGVETDVNVELTNFEFTPDEVTVAEGGTVTFEQVAGAHNVLIYDEDGELVDGEEQIGGWDTFEFAAEEAGSYTFDCTPHAGMDGTLDVVGEGSGNGEDDTNGDDEADRGDEETSETYEVDVPLDQTPPQTTASVDGPQAGDVFTEATLVLEGADETSGLAETHVREQGQDGHDVYVDPVALPAGDGQVFEYRSTDEAGNVEDWGSVTIDVDPTLEPDQPDDPAASDDPATGDPSDPGDAGPLPDRVDAGSGGLLADPAGLPAWVIALMALGIVGIVGPLVAASRRTRSD